jgi:endogenous inhibitor of DNA gyrase (YacG/DUF329 family)
MVTCPKCGEVSPYSPANRWRPFCSERCKMIDLGTWASDGYVVAGEPLEADDDLIDPETGKPRGTQGPAASN